MGNTAPFVFQLSKHFAQNRSVGLAKNAVPKLAIIFKQVPGAVAARYPLGQVKGLFKVGWGEVTVRRSQGQGHSKRICRPVGQLQSALW